MSEVKKDELYKVGDYNHEAKEWFTACGVDEERFSKFTKMLIKALLKDGKTSTKAEMIESLITKYPDVYPRFVAVFVAKLARAPKIAAEMSNIIHGENINKVMEKTVEQITKMFAQNVVEVVGSTDPEELAENTGMPIELARQIVDQVKENGSRGVVINPKSMLDKEDINIEDFDIEKTMKEEEEISESSTKIKH